MSQTNEDRPVSRSRPSWVSAATRDAIRHFAWGIGDNNPLWTDPDYARASRWGGLIAPPCFLYGVDETTVASGLPDHRRLYRSVEWTFYDVVRLGTNLEASAWLTGEAEVDGTLEQFGRVDFHVAGGSLVARAETQCARTAQPAIAVDDRPEVRYTGEQLETIERTILAEARQGATSRNWEEVSVGDGLGPLVKGPLSIMDVVAWSAATSGVVDDDCGYSEGGLDDQSATGPEQIAWIGQMLTDWMGDHAFLHRLKIEVIASPPLGATTTITGQVTAVELVEGRPTAHIALTATDQDDQVTAQGTAEIVLPSVEHGPVSLPIET